MKQITSKDNEWFKYLKKLCDHAPTRRREKRAIIEGIHACQMLASQHLRPVYAVFSDLGLMDPEILAIYESLDSECCYVISGDLMQRLEQVENGQGILFVIDVVQTELEIPASSTALMLDRIQDPGNLGTILRTALGAGVTSIYLSKGCADVWSPKVIRAAQGAHFSVSIYTDVELDSVIRSSNLPVLVTSLDGADNLYQTVLPEHAIWVFGNEGQGVSEHLLALASQKVMIPLHPQLESLNVAIASALCLYEQRRQHVHAT